MMDRPGVDGLAAQECFDEADPEGGSDGDGVVVEIVAGVVQQAGAIAVAVGTVGSVAVAQEEVAAWALEQHEGEVFGGHDGIDGGDDVVGADDVGEDLCDEGGLFGIVDGGRVVAQEAEFDFGAKAAADAFGEGFHPGFDEVDHFDGEGPDGTAQCGVVGDDVDGVTGVDLGDGKDGGFDGVAVAADDGLEGLDQGGCDGDGIDAVVGHGGVGAFAGDDDLEGVGGGEDGAGTDADLTDGHAGPVVKAEDGVAGEAFEESVLDHGATATKGFFGGLEDEVEGAVEVLVGGEVFGGGQQDGGVAVMAAGMHATGVAGVVAEGVGFLHGQGIHVGADADAAGAVAAFEGADDASLAQAGGDFIAPFAQFVGYQGGGAGLFETQFGMGMDVASQGGEFGVRGLDVVDDLHGGSL